MPSDPLAPFLPPVRAWFRQALGAPTAPQAEGWPAIQRGEHTLILAPTGSGKTLAAFLWGLNELFREPGASSDTTPPFSHSLRGEKGSGDDHGPRNEVEREGGRPPGVRLLYVSPLKALNNDIERNLRVPLDGIRAAARQLGQALPGLRVAVRTGDTPAAARAQMVKQPPHILITTPESLYLILTSPRAREMFRTVHTVIVDEIHTLAGSKRGAHLALSLERLEAILAAAPNARVPTDESAAPPAVLSGAHSRPSTLTHLPLSHASAPARLQRIGLSATIRPLEEAARFLGGQQPGPGGLLPRPVTIVNAGYRKPLDLNVVTVVDDFQDLPASSIWPAVVPRVLDDIRRHRTTLIFANNRRLAERTADRLNAQLEGEQSEEAPPGSTEILAPGGLARDRGMFAIGAEGPFRAHHGSMSKEARLQMEADLKAGRLPALVGTSSLELGIDIGAVDVVVQLQSPKSVSQGLQRVGRSGHLVGQTSKGRIYATFREDLVEAAAIARGMLDGAVELTYTPRNPLDVLAQQIVAMVSIEDWPAQALYDLARQAYPYADLPLSVFHAVLDMLTGRYFLDLAEAHDSRALNSLRPKIAWDRASDTLTALPGSRLLALSNAGTIPDTGGFGVYLADGKTRLGELDEEFVLETRVGDAFLLGSSVWRVTEIGNDRVTVTGAAGATPRMPFWNGDYPYRPYELGQRLGRFRREVVEHLAVEPPAATAAWLRRDYVLDENSARNLIAHVQRQLDAVGVMSSDTTLVIETFQNAVGDRHLAIHSPYGGRVNGAWALALLSAFRERLGVTPEVQTSDDGLLFRFPDAGPAAPVDVVRALTPAAARERLLQELPGSAVFGARFRMNAGRALLLPRARGGKRTPFWLQRLRAKDLLALVQSNNLNEFPIVAETYRDCLQDVFDLPHLEELLTRVGQGEVRLVHIETVSPSPVAAGLLYNFASTYLYEWDAPKAERQLQTLSLTGALLGAPPAGVPDGDHVVVPFTGTPGPASSDSAAVPRAQRSPQGVTGAPPSGGRVAVPFTGTPLDLSDLLRPDAIVSVTQQAAHRAPGYRARTLEEFAFILRELGDLTPAEAQAVVAAPLPAHADTSLPAAPPASSASSPASTRTTLPAAPPAPAESAPAPADMSFRAASPLRGEESRLSAAWLDTLASQGRAAAVYLERLSAARASDEPRWVAGELAELYRAVFASPAALPSLHPPALALLRRHLRWAGPVTAASLLARYPFQPSWLDAALAALIQRREVVLGHFTRRDALEYCDAHLLDHIRRRTLTLLRNEVQPVGPAAYADFLARWQQVVPAAHVAAQPDSVSTAPVTPAPAAPALSAPAPDGIFEQMRGLALPASLWTDEVLPARLGASSASALASTPNLVWAGDPATASDPKRPRFRFFFRGEGGVFLDSPAGADLALSPAARLVLDFLKSEGASFTSDLLAGAQLHTESLTPAVHELVLAGLVTNDSPSAVLELLSAEALPPPPHTSTPSHSPSSLAADLAARLGDRQGKGPRPLSATRYRAAKQRVARRLQAQLESRVSAPAPVPASAGRWALIHRAGILGPALAPDERLRRLARLLLARYGVVARESLDRETLPADWSQLYPVLQNMELRGEVRRGYFVTGLSGAQFALPEAVERLRAAPGDAVFLLNAADPANIYGGDIALPSGHTSPPRATAPVPPAAPNSTEDPPVAAPFTGASSPPIDVPSAPLRFARLPSTHLALWRGAIAVLFEDNGDRLTAAPGLPPEVLRHALAAYLNRPASPRRIVVSTWNGTPVHGSPGQPLLRSLGFQNTPSGMEWRGGP